MKTLGGYFAFVFFCVFALFYVCTAIIMILNFLIISVFKSVVPIIVINVILSMAISSFCCKELLLFLLEKKEIGKNSSAVWRKKRAHKIKVTLKQIQIGILPILLISVICVICLVIFFDKFNFQDYQLRSLFGGCVAIPVYFLVNWIILMRHYIEAKCKKCHAINSFEYKESFDYESENSVKEKQVQYSQTIGKVYSGNKEIGTVKQNGWRTERKHIHTDRHKERYICVFCGEEKIMTKAESRQATQDEIDDMYKK